MAARIYTPETAPGLKDLLFRLLLVVVLIAGASVFVYVEGGLNDSRTGRHPGYWDSLYFAIVTITTVGYGDIVPVETHSRLLDAFVLTPLRFVVMFVILGTAYQIAYRRFREEYRMKRATMQLSEHIVVCGYGSTGRAAVRELMLQGTSPDQIAIIDNNPLVLEEATETGAVCVVGDATREYSLESVRVGDAAHVLVCPGRDDTAVLIALTVRDLNPEAQVIAMCQEAENVKLLERGGAHHIVNPALAGGNLMAAATRRGHLVDTLEDLLTVGGALQLKEREVHPEEAGQKPGALPGMTVVRVYRGERPRPVAEVSILEPGDVIVYLRAGEG